MRHLRLEVALIPTLLLVLTASTGMDALNTQGGARPEYSDYPCAITLGTGQNMSSTTFSIFAQARPGTPVNNASIVVDFAMCPGLVRLATDQPDGLTADCVAKTVHGFTDAAGRLSMNIRGSWSAPGEPDTPCMARIYADGWLFAVVPVATFDLSGDGDLTAADLSLLLEDNLRYAHKKRARSDFDRPLHGDCEHDLTAADLAVWLTAAIHPGEPITSFCP